MIEGRKKKRRSKRKNEEKKKQAAREYLDIEDDEKSAQEIREMQIGAKVLYIAIHFIFELVIWNYDNDMLLEIKARNYKNAAIFHVLMLVSAVLLWTVGKNPGYLSFEKVSPNADNNNEAHNSIKDQKGGVLKKEEEVTFIQSQGSKGLHVPVPCNGQDEEDEFNIIFDEEE